MPSPISDVYMQRTPLAAADRPKTYFCYYVTGHGHFPVDMLRYDRAWPADGLSAAAILQTDRTLRTIALRSYTEPTLGRWASFLWSVHAHKEQ